MPGFCKCVACVACDGRGWIFVDQMGRYVAYGDSLSDTECCDECGGHGTIDECDYCLESREQEEEGWI